MSNLWHTILESNTFNFAILVILIVALLEKVNIPKALENLKETIINKIKASEQAKADAETKLSEAKTKVENLDNEISEKIKIAGLRADNVADSINKGTQRKIHQISANSKRVIENDGKTLISILSDITAENSIETAEKYIRNKLKTEPSLHEKYINESIENLEKVLL